MTDAENLAWALKQLLNAEKKIMELNNEKYQALEYISNVPLHTEDHHALHFVEMARTWLQKSPAREQDGFLNLNQAFEKNHTYTKLDNYHHKFLCNKSIWYISRIGDYEEARQEAFLIFFRHWLKGKYDQKFLDIPEFLRRYDD